MRNGRSMEKVAAGLALVLVCLVGCSKSETDAASEIAARWLLQGVTEKAVTNNHVMHTVEYEYCLDLTDGDQYSRLVEGEVVDSGTCSLADNTMTLRSAEDDHSMLYFYHVLGGHTLVLCQLEYEREYETFQLSWDGSMIYTRSDGSSWIGAPSFEIYDSLPNPDDSARLFNEWAQDHYQ